MGLQIESLSLRHFRNYESFALDDIGKLTVFIGDNAVGKTNILEAINLLTSASSFRHPQISQLIQEGCESSSISCLVSDGHRQLETALMLEPGKKRYSVNGKSKGAVDVRGNLPSVVFTPDDLKLAKGSSSSKRDALDDLGMQLTRNYYIVRRDYEKTVRYKNRLLKEEASRALVESINETLVICGSQLFCFRTALFERMIPRVARVYSDIAKDGERFEARYLPSWEKVDGIDVMGASTLDGTNREEIRRILVDYLSEYFEEERSRRRSLIGPHNDQVAFLLDGRDVAAFASQGQQRSLVLAWKLSEVEVIREAIGVNPVLLLDDVLSELDENRREMLIGFVTDEIQTFVTATDLSGFSNDLVEKARVVRLPYLCQQGDK